MKDSTNMGDDSNGRRLMAEIIGDALWEENRHGKHSNNSSGSGWAPFDNPRNGNVLLGDLDVAFLGAYAIGMFVSGHLGDRLDLRKFLTWGMIGSGTCVCLFGVAYFADIHAMPYFLSIQLVGGLVQATGWPSVVTVMANWFGHGKRGLIMGVWNAHTSVGNILGSLMAASMLQYGWGWSFIVPGLLIIVAGILIFSFLVVEPQDIGFMPQSGSHLGSFAASEAGTPRGDDNQLSASDKELLERRLAHIAETHDGMVPSQVAASMEAHHHIRRPQHGMVAMGSTLVMVNDDRDSIDVRFGVVNLLPWWNFLLRFLCQCCRANRMMSRLLLLGIQRLHQREGNLVYHFLLPGGCLEWLSMLSHCFLPNLWRIRSSTGFHIIFHPRKLEGDRFLPKRQANYQYCLMLVE
jgi:hypothetical protein